MSAARTIPGNLFAEVLSMQNDSEPGSARSGA